MTMAGRSFDSLHLAVDSVLEARTLDDALGGIVATLREEFDIHGAACALVGEGRARVVAMRTDHPETFFVSGTEINFGLTEDTRAVYDVLVARGRAVTFGIGDLDVGLLRDLLEAEGIISIAGVPLFEGGMVHGVIGLSSHAKDALVPAHVPFLTGLGRGIEEKMIMLMRMAERS